MIKGSGTRVRRLCGAAPYGLVELGSQSSDLLLQVCHPGHLGLQASDLTFETQDAPNPGDVDPGRREIRDLA